MFDPAHFWEFAAQGFISTKDYGLVRFDKPNGCQRYFIDQIALSLKEGRHIIVVLKSRQQGISTLMCVLDLYWLFTNPSMESTIIVPDEKLRDKFRTDIVTFYEGLPARWKNKLEKDNGNQMVFLAPDGQRAKFVWQIASDRANDKLGKGLGITFLHATEPPLWGVDASAYANLEASFSGKNPQRLFVYESTAKGHDLFKDLWDAAKKATGRSAIFIPWWLHEDYTLAQDSNAFNTYFGRPLTGSIWKRLDARETELWIRARHEHGYQPTAGQVAWMRYQIEEKSAGDYDSFLENYPITEHDAFRVTGSAFFPNAQLDKQLTIAAKTRPAFYHMSFGEHWWDTRVEPCKEAKANLKVWENPAPKTGGRVTSWYTAGADPAYGSSDWADDFAISVFRAYADGKDQVAEFCTADCNTTWFAWAICYLAGWYGNTWVNLELTGPGQVVLNEFQMMKSMPSHVARMMGLDAPGEALEMRKRYRETMKAIHEFRFQRFNGGVQKGNLRHWQATEMLKHRMFNQMRDSFYLGMLNIRSKDTLEEMLTVRTQPGKGFIGGAGRDKDDLVIAAGLAHVTWVENLRAKLIKLGHTREAALKADQSLKATPSTLMHQSIISDFMSASGLIPSRSPTMRP